MMRFALLAEGAETRHLVASVARALADLLDDDPDCKDGLVISEIEGGQAEYMLITDADGGDGTMWAAIKTYIGSPGANTHEVTS